jgi:IS605 OrfB family transposase
MSSISSGSTPPLVLKTMPSSFFGEDTPPRAAGLGGEESPFFLSPTPELRYIKPMELHLTIKAKLLLSAEARLSLRSTMEEFNRACNTLSQMAYELNLHRKYDLHHSSYRLIRQETTLPAQHVINAIAKVSAACTRDSKTLHRFKPHSSVRYDARTMRLGPDVQTASLTICPKGRITGRLQMSAAMRSLLLGGKSGAAELVYRRGNFYLHISLMVAAPEVTPPIRSLGVDLGVKRIAVTSGNNFQSARWVRHRKACSKRTRRSLQANGSKSAKRVLKGVSGRERRFVSDVNHCVSKRIVAEALAAGQRIVLEDLNGIRQSSKAKCIHDWSFAELQRMISYKAARSGVEVVYIDPRYTSQTCSRCLHLGLRTDQSNFHCRDCGYRLNADLNGRNLSP